MSNSTRLILANALYLKAAWAKPFSKNVTGPEPFHVRGATSADVPTMLKQEPLGYAKRDGFSIVALPYNGSELQLVILLPDTIDAGAGSRKSSAPAPSRSAQDCRKPR